MNEATESTGPAVTLAGDLIWEVAGIAKEIGRSRRQTFHLLETGQLPAEKIGGRWCSSRAALRRRFAMLSGGVA